MPRAADAQMKRLNMSWMGPAACEHCNRLQTVDISRTDISEIQGGTFARCSQLQRLKLATTVRRIWRDAFLRCTSLVEIHTPPALLLANEPLQAVLLQATACPLQPSLIVFQFCTHVCALVQRSRRALSLSIWDWG